MKVDISIALTKNGKPMKLSQTASSEDEYKALIEYIRWVFVVVAEEVRDEAVQSGELQEGFITTVDGSNTRDIVAVRPFGNIHFTNPSDARDVALECYRTIVENSPVESGAYKASHVVLYDKAIVATDLPSMEKWAKEEQTDRGKQIMIINTQPYARRLERYGITRKTQARKAAGGKGTAERMLLSKDRRKRARGIRVQAPNGVYYLAFRSISRKYGRNTAIYFRLVSGSNFMGSIGMMSERRYSPFGPNRRGSGKQSTYMYPAIIINVGQKDVI